MYSLIDVNDNENKKAKGVNRGVVKGIRHRQLFNVLFGIRLMWQR